MGQAKLRGTQEQRAAQAIEREALARAERDRREAEAKEAERQRIAALPPEQRDAEIATARSRHFNMATWLAIGAAFGSPVVLRTRRGKA